MGKRPSTSRNKPSSNSDRRGVCSEGPPNAENRPFVDQRAAARWKRVEQRVLAEPALFAAQGAVVASWRVRGERRLGPYFRLAYRENGRQRSVYLGRCRELVRRVRSLLARLQSALRERRRLRRLQAQVRASLRRCKARLAEALAPWGVRTKGFEFRGARRALARYVEARYGPGLSERIGQALSGRRPPACVTPGGARSAPCRPSAGALRARLPSRRPAGSFRGWRSGRG